MTTHPDRPPASGDPAIGSPAGLGPLLLRTRRAQARSQQRIAEQLCAVAGLVTVSRHEVSRWERGERIPSPYWLAWLGVVLDIPLTDLERAAAVTRDHRIRPAASAAAPPSITPPPAAASPTAPPLAAVWPMMPAGWPWRMIPAYAVATPDGGVRLHAAPPVDGRHRATLRRAALRRASARASAGPITPTVTVQS